MGSAGSNTTADHITVLTEAIAQLPARYRLDLLITVDGVGASHGLVDHIPCSTPHRGGGCTTHRLGAGHPGTSGHHLGAKSAWGIVLETEGQPREVDEAGVVELTALLRHGPLGDQLVNWPEDMCIVARRERAPPRRAALAVRSHRRVALPAPGHQHPTRERPIRRGPPPPDLHSSSR
jgi:hypothetical protein